MTSNPAPARSYLGYVGFIVPATCVLAILHFGQDFIKPIAIAAILSLVIAPMVRKLAATGLGRTTSTLISVLAVTALVGSLSVVIAMQLVDVASDLPQYRNAIKTKVESIRKATVGPFEQLDAVLKIEAQTTAPPPATTSARNRARLNNTEGPVQVEIRPPTQSASGMISKVLSAIWGPLGEAGIVLVLLVFILLEHESLGDRFIRLFGEAEMGATVQTLNDTAKGVSRYFLSQAVVNTAFGIVVGFGLWAIGIPHAVLWGTLSGLLRFIPYVGILGAGAAIAVFSAAVDPGWTLMLSSIGLFLALELAVAHVIEPQVYGHSTGLAPLAVIVSALFWGAIWGPAGLLLSTPLTLCIVVIGRHVKAFAPITILLSESTGLSAGQRFYQRALAGNVTSIVQDARKFLRRRTVAKYCDDVLLPGLAMAGTDFALGRIDLHQRNRIQSNIVIVAEALTTTRVDRRTGRRAPVSLVNANVGAHLRQLRETRLGKWQGPLDVPSKSVVLCVGFGTERDDVLIELLVRSLRQDNVDARSVSLDEPADEAMKDKSILVGTVFMVYPGKEGLAAWTAAVAELREALPHAIFATVKLRMEESVASPVDVQPQVDLILHSYAEAEGFVLQGGGPL